MFGPELSTLSGGFWVAVLAECVNPLDGEGIAHGRASIKFDDRPPFS